MTLAMISVGLAFPFSAGLVAAFNPCGFAMLPTYLAYFMGQDDTDAEPSLARNVSRGLVVGLTLTAGFFLVFGGLGVLTSHFLSRGSVVERLPWVTLILGILMVPIGIAMVLGFEPKISTPRMSKGGGSRELGSIFMFGVSYAVVSFGCTAPLFLGTVASSFTNDGFANGLATFMAYASGMAAVVVFLTMAVALARGAIAKNMRRILPYVNRVSGALLFFGGLYVAAYGWWEIRVFRDPTGATENRFQKILEDFQADLNGWIQDIGAGRLGLILLAIIAGAVIATQVWSRTRSASAGGPGPGAGSPEAI